MTVQRLKYILKVAEVGCGWSIHWNWSRLCGAESLHGLRDCSRRKKVVPDYNFRLEACDSSLQKIRIHSEKADVEMEYIVKNVSGKE